MPKALLFRELWVILAGWLQSTAGFLAGCDIAHWMKLAKSIHVNGQA
jgi:hypothetical protein